MAVTYKGLTIEFGGDTTKLQDALKRVQSSAKETQSDLKAIERSLKFNPGNTDLLNQKVRSLNKAYDETKDKLAAYRSAYEQLDAKRASGADMTEQEVRQYESLQRAILQCENQLESYEEAIKSTQREADASQTGLYKMGQTLEDNAEKFGEHGQRMQTVGKAMMGTSTAIAGAAVAAFNEVDSGMDAVVKATGATGDAASELGESVKNVAGTLAGASSDWETLGYTVGEVSTRFGASGKDLEDLTETFFQFSEITGTDSVQAVQQAAMAMQAFGVDSSHTSEVLGVFAKVAQDSGMSTDELMNAVVTNGATFREMGLDIDDAAVMLGKFEQAGVPADQMLTGLKKAAANCAKEGTDLGSTLQDLTSRLQDPATAAEATQEAIELFGSKAAMSFVDAAKSGRVNFDDLQATLSDYGNVVGDTFGETVDGVDQANVAMKELQAAGAELGGALSDIAGPVLHDLAEMAKSAADAFGNLTPEQKEFAAKAVIAVGAAGALTAGLGGLFGAIGNIGSGLKAASSAMGLVKDGWGALTGFIAANPIALGIAAVAAAVAGLTWFFTQTETGKQMWADFTAFLLEAWEGVKTYFAGVGEWWAGVWDGVKELTAAAKDAIAETWENLKVAASEKWEAIKGAISEKATAIKDGLSTSWENVKTATKEAWGNIKTATTEKWQSIKDTVTQKVQALKDSASNTVENLRDTVSSVWDGLTSATSDKWSQVQDFVSNAAQGARDAVDSAFGGLDGIVSGIWGSIKDSISSAMDWASSAVSDAVWTIRNALDFDFSWPHIPLPHFSWHWESIGGLLSLPFFDGIDWYANGGAFKPNMPHLVGVGDSRETEYITPESKLMDAIETAIKNVGGASGISINVEVNAQLKSNLDGFELGQHIGRGIQTTLKQQGVSYAIG